MENYNCTNPPEILASLRSWDLDHSPHSKCTINPEHAHSICLSIPVQCGLFTPKEVHHQLASSSQGEKHPLHGKEMVTHASCTVPCEVTLTWNGSTSISGFWNVSKVDSCDEKRIWLSHCSLMSRKCLYTKARCVSCPMLLCCDGATPHCANGPSSFSNMPSWLCANEPNAQMGSGEQLH